MENRHIPLQGTPNFRDLGGYRSRCNRTVVSGRFFRSGTLAYLHERDWQELADRRVSLICDLRRDDERRYEPTQVPDGLEIDILELPVGAGSHTGFVEKLLQEAEVSGEPMADMMRNINRAFVLEHHEPFRKLMQAAIEMDGDQALVFHCAAGKDRTGFAAAMLLSCLNVDREIILEDYLLTRRYFKPDEQLHNLRDRLAQIDWDALHSSRMLPMLDTQASYLLAAFDAIDTQWGSTEAFLEQGLGIDTATRDAMRARFLVD